MHDGGTLTQNNAGHVRYPQENLIEDKCSLRQVDMYTATTLKYVGRARSPRPGGSMKHQFHPCI